MRKTKIWMKSTCPTEQRLLQKQQLRLSGIIIFSAENVSGKIEKYFEKICNHKSSKYDFALGFFAFLTTGFGGFGSSASPASQLSTVDFVISVFATFSGTAESSLFPSSVSATLFRDALSFLAFLFLFLPRMSLNISSTFSSLSSNDLQSSLPRLNTCR